MKYLLPPYSDNPHQSLTLEFPPPPNYQRLVLPDSKSDLLTLGLTKEESAEGESAEGESAEGESATSLTIAFGQVAVGRLVIIEFYHEVSEGSPFVVSDTAKQPELTEKLHGLMDLLRLSLLAQDNFMRYQGAPIDEENTTPEVVEAAYRSAAWIIVANRIWGNEKLAEATFQVDTDMHTTIIVGPVREAVENARRTATTELPAVRTRFCRKHQC